MMRETVMLRLPFRLILRLHRDDRGNLGILLLLTIWALIGLIGMVWNTSEYATRRQHVQNAVDTSAHSAVEWTSRTTNLLAASNVLMGENASAEIILRAIPPTISGLRSRLNREAQMIAQALGQAQQGQGQNQQLPNPDPSAAARLALLTRVLPQLLAELKSEQALAQQFITQASVGLAIMDPSELPRRRTEIYDYQQQIIDLTPQVVEEQRAELASFYKCDVLLANPSQTNLPDAQSDTFTPPVKSVNDVNVEGVTMWGVNVPDPDDGEVWVEGGSWGWINDPPLRRFVNDRVWRDQRGLESLLKPLDDQRSELAQFLDQLLGIPANAWAPNADPALIQQITRGYTDAANQVRRMRLTDLFAVNIWHNNVNAMRESVLHSMGETPQFAFVTYDRYPIPAWAQSGVYNDAHTYVYNDVYGRNHVRLWWRRFNEVRAQLLKQKVPQQQAVQRARAAADEFSTRIATIGATQIADDAATQWINRTWPYELPPPQTQVPPAQGPTKEDRLQYLTMVGAAKTTDENAVKLMLPRLYNSNTKPMVAYAQSENFNWMEFNGSYGAGDRYDRRMPPDPWRVSTIGGWNWQPRLSLSDGFGQVMDNHPQFRSFIEEGGVGYDPQVIDDIVLH